MSADSYTRMDDAAGHVCDPTTSPQSDFVIIEPIRCQTMHYERYCTATVRLP